MRRTLLAAALLCGSALSGSLQDHNCSDYDVDTLYTNVTCSSYDETSCDLFCSEGSVCDYFCGTGEISCATGGGAICAMRHLSHVTVPLEVAICAKASTNSTTVPLERLGSWHRLLKSPPPVAAMNVSILSRAMF